MYKIGGFQLVLVLWLGWYLFDTFIVHAQFRFMSYESQIPLYISSIMSVINIIISEYKCLAFLNDEFDLSEKMSTQMILTQAMDGSNEFICWVNCIVKFSTQSQFNKYINIQYSQYHVYRATTIFVLMILKIFKEAFYAKFILTDSTLILIFYL